MDLVPWPKI